MKKKSLIYVLLAMGCVLFIVCTINIIQVAQLPGNTATDNEIVLALAGDKGVAQDTLTSCSSSSYPCDNAHVGQLCGACVGGKNMTCAPIDPEKDCTLYAQQYCCTVTQQCYAPWIPALFDYYCSSAASTGGPSPVVFNTRTIASN
ncbi:MAG: hypothetical protein LBE13_01470 [Bacteroidales bacterium]|jgi:hypothetical protein|nr:hypothetical protein [Bacteroidales bacterium]